MKWRPVGNVPTVLEVPSGGIHYSKVSLRPGSMDGTGIGLDEWTMDPTLRTALLGSNP